MAAVIRLKRRSDEEPLEALVLACKRKKLDGDLETIKEDAPYTTVLKFAGTVKNQDEDVTAHITKNLKDDKKSLLQHIPDITDKIRTEKKQASQENRLKVVNCFRALKEVDGSESEKGDEKSASVENGEGVTIVDVVSHLEDGKEPNSSSQLDSKTETDDSSDPEAGYVYDLYYTSSGIDDRLMHLEDLVSVRPLYQSEWEYRNPEDSDVSENDDEDEEDSNDENNWRNDYPDSDHSIDEDDMRMAVEMNDMNLSDGDDLSSDTADEDFVYGVNVDPKDVMLYGEGYANYKARILNELDGKSKSDEDEEFNHEPLSGDEEDPTQRFS